MGSRKGGDGGAGQDRPQYDDRFYTSGREQTKATKKSAAPLRVVPTADDPDPDDVRLFVNSILEAPNSKVFGRTHGGRDPRYLIRHPNDPEAAAPPKRFQKKGN